MIRRLLFSAALLITVLAAITLILLPPRAVTPSTAAPPLTWPVVKGAFHVHSERSDGTGTLDEIAAAAAAAGLQFVIMTDHGDGTRQPEPPMYRSGVLMIDGVEISTDDGHYAVVGLARTPYRLAGHARGVIEDVHRFGGFGFTAHPGSPKPALQWRDWNASFDGIEWLNADSEWRDEFWSSIGAVLLTYPFRPVETLGSMLDRPADVISAWQSATRSRRVAAIAGSDAHARLAYRQSVDPYRDRVLARVPSYEVSFRTFVNHVLLASPLGGQAEADAEALVTSLREGRIFTSIEAFAQLGGFEAKALSGGAVALPGAYLDVTAPVAIEAAIAAPPGTTLEVWRDDERLFETRESALRIDVGKEPGAYRVEARLPSQDHGSIPWVMTNPFYVGLGAAHAGEMSDTSPRSQARASVATESWSAESSAGSSSAFTPSRLPDGTPAVEWQYALDDDEGASPFAAIRFPAPGNLVGFEGLQMRAQSDQPRRIWVQLRTPGSAGGERWGTSFFVGSDLREVDLLFDDFRSFEGAGRQVPLGQIDSLLLVIDSVNTIPGSSGRITITDLWLVR